MGMFFILQLVGPMSSAVTRVLSVCLRPGIVMERQTVWMLVMNSGVLCPAALHRCPAWVETSVWTVKISAMAPLTAGTLQMRVSITVVIWNSSKTTKTSFFLRLWGNIGSCLSTRIGSDTSLPGRLLVRQPHLCERVESVQWFSRLSAGWRWGCLWWVLVIRRRDKWEQ